MTDGIIQSEIDRWYSQYVQYSHTCWKSQIDILKKELIEKIKQESEKWRLSTSRVEVRYGITLLKDKLIGDNQQ